MPRVISVIPSSVFIPRQIQIFCRNYLLFMDSGRNRVFRIAWKTFLHVKVLTLGPEDYRNTLPATATRPGCLWKLVGKADFLTQDADNRLQTPANEGEMHAVYTNTQQAHSPIRELWTGVVNTVPSSPDRATSYCSGG
jgi:hypothetical protein